MVLKLLIGVWSVTATQQESTSTSSEQVGPESERQSAGFKPESEKQSATSESESDYQSSPEFGKQSSTPAKRPTKKSVSDFSNLPRCQQWKEAFDKSSKRVYYYNVKTSTTVWEKPKSGSIARELPKGWTEIGFSKVRNQWDLFKLKASSEAVIKDSHDTAGSADSSNAALEGDQDGGQQRCYDVEQDLYYVFEHEDEIACVQKERPLLLDDFWSYAWERSEETIVYHRLVQIENPAPYDPTSSTSPDKTGAAVTKAAIEKKDSNAQVESYNLEENSAKCHPWQRLEARDSMAKHYFWNRKTGRTQWEPPIPSADSNLPLPTGWKQYRLKNELSTTDEQYVYVLNNVCHQQERPLQLLSPWTYQYDVSRKTLFFQHTVRQSWPVPMREYSVAEINAARETEKQIREAHDMERIELIRTVFQQKSGTDNKSAISSGFKAADSSDNSKNADPDTEEFEATVVTTPLPEVATPEFPVQPHEAPPTSSTSFGMMEFVAVILVGVVVGLVIHAHKLQQNIQAAVSVAARPLVNTPENPVVAPESSEKKPAETAEKISVNASDSARNDTAQDASSATQVTLETAPVKLETTPQGASSAAKKTFFTVEEFPCFEMLEASPSMVSEVCDIEISEKVYAGTVKTAAETKPCKATTATTSKPNQPMERQLSKKVKRTAEEEEERLKNERECIEFYCMSPRSEGQTDDEEEDFFPAVFTSTAIKGRPAAEPKVGVSGKAHNDLPKHMRDHGPEIENEKAITASNPTRTLDMDSPQKLRSSRRRQTLA